MGQRHQGLGIGVQRIRVGVQKRSDPFGRCGGKFGSHRVRRRNGGVDIVGTADRELRPDRLAGGGVGSAKTAGGIAAGLPLAGQQHGLESLGHRGTFGYVEAPARSTGDRTADEGNAPATCHPFESWTTTGTGPYNAARTAAALNKAARRRWRVLSAGWARWRWRGRSPSALPRARHRPPPGVAHGHARCPGPPFPAPV